MEAVIGRRPSQIWRILCWGRQIIIKAGGIWRVGNGRGIRTYKDQSLPCLGSLCVLSPCMLCPE